MLQNIIEYLVPLLKYHPSQTHIVQEYCTLEIMLFHTDNTSLKEFERVELMYLKLN